MLDADCITDEVLELEAHRDKMAEMLLKLCNVLGSVTPRQVTRHPTYNENFKIDTIMREGCVLSLNLFPIQYVVIFRHDSLNFAKLIQTAHTKYQPQR